MNTRMIILTIAIALTTYSSFSMAEPPAGTPGGMNDFCTRVITDATAAGLVNGIGTPSSSCTVKQRELMDMVSVCNTQANKQGCTIRRRTNNTMDILLNGQVITSIFESARNSNDLNMTLLEKTNETFIQLSGLCSSFNKPTCEIDRINHNRLDIKAGGHVVASFFGNRHGWQNEDELMNLAGNAMNKLSLVCSSFRKPTCSFSPRKNNRNVVDFTMAGKPLFALHSNSTHLSQISLDQIGKISGIMNRMAPFCSTVRKPVCSIRRHDNNRGSAHITINGRAVFQFYENDSYMNNRNMKLSEKLGAAMNMLAPMCNALDKPSCMITKDRNNTNMIKVRVGSAEVFNFFSNKRFVNERNDNLLDMASASLRNISKVCSHFRKPACSITRNNQNNMSLTMNGTTIATYFSNQSWHNKREKELLDLTSGAMKKIGPFCSSGLNAMIKPFCRISNSGGFFRILRGPEVLGTYHSRNDALGALHMLRYSGHCR